MRSRFVPAAGLDWCCVLADGEERTCWSTVTVGDPVCSIYHIYWIWLCKIVPWQISGSQERIHGGGARGAIPLSQTAADQTIKKLIRRWDSERELTLRPHRTHSVTAQNTITDSCINSATDRRGYALFTKFSTIKKLIMRWDSESELSLRRCTRTKNTIDSCINSTTDRFLQCRFTKFSGITQCNGHYAVQGHSRSPILVPIESSYATSY